MLEIIGFFTVLVMGIFVLYQGYKAIYNRGYDDGFAERGAIEAYHYMDRYLKEKQKERENNKAYKEFMEKCLKDEAE